MIRAMLQSWYRDLFRSRGGGNVTWKDFSGIEEKKSEMSFQICYLRYSVVSVGSSQSQVLTVDRRSWMAHLLLTLGNSIALAAAHNEVTMTYICTFQV